MSFRSAGPSALANSRCRVRRTADSTSGLKMSPRFAPFRYAMIACVRAFWWASIWAGVDWADGRDLLQRGLPQLHVLLDLVLELAQGLGVHLHGLRRDDRLLGRARAGRGGQRPGKGGPAKEHGAFSHHLVPHCGHSWFTTSSRLCLKTSTQSSSVTRRSPSGARVFSSRRSKRPARNMSRIWASESCTSRSARNLRPPSLIRGFTRVPLSDFFWLAALCRASFHRGCDRHASRSTRVLLSSVALPKVRPTSWTYRNGFLQSSLRASSLPTPSDRHMSFWFLALLSLCWRKTASSLMQSRFYLYEPP